MATRAMNKTSVHVVRKLLVQWRKDCKRLEATWKGTSNHLESYYEGQRAAFKTAARTLRRLYQNPIPSVMTTVTEKTPGSSDGGIKGC